MKPRLQSWEATESQGPAESSQKSVVLRVGRDASTLSPQYEGMDLELRHNNVLVQTSPSHSSGSLHTGHNLSGRGWGGFRSDEVLVQVGDEESE